METLARLQKVLHDDFKIPLERVTRDAHLRTDLGLDSLALTDLFFLLKQDFRLPADLGPEAFRGLVTVGKLADFLAAHE